MPFAVNRDARRTRDSSRADQSRSSGASITAKRSGSKVAKASRSRLSIDWSCSASTIPKAMNTEEPRNRATAQPASSASAVVQGFTSTGPRASPAMSAISGIAAGTSLRTLERRERLDVMSVWEKVEEVECGEAPAGRDQPARVTGKGYRIAGEICNPFFRPFRDCRDDLAPRARARRIEKDEVGLRKLLRVSLDRIFDDARVRRKIDPRVMRG